MKELMVTEKEFKMTSLDLANITGKRHDHILRDIKDEIDKLGEKGLLIFGESKYKNSQNKFMAQKPMGFSHRYTITIFK